MADELKRPVGAVDKLEVRRIGANHAVVMPPREAKLIDVGEFRREVAAIERRLEGMAEERTRLEAIRADRLLIIGQVDAAPIDRIDGDPDVPQPPRPEPVEAAPAVALTRPVRGG